MFWSVSGSCERVVFSEHATREELLEPVGAKQDDASQDTIGNESGTQLQHTDAQLHRTGSPEISPHPRTCSALFVALKALSRHLFILVILFCF